MAHHSPIFKITRVHAAALICIGFVEGAMAQNSPAEITITSSTPQRISGFGDVLLFKAPFSAISIDNQTLRDIGATRISDALRLDASVTDSYNSPAYWDMLSVRGYTLDNRYNFRREGLPISAETMIPLENKERIELLKGTSGIQAGTSAPGGLANYIIKRPPTDKAETLRAVTANYSNGKSRSIGLDLGNRFGESKEFGYRLNTAYEDLNPYIQNTQGHRNLVALAMDWRMTADSKLDFEFEKSERQQIGVNAYSLLDRPSNQLPTAVDGSRNITRQSWSLPSIFAGTTGSLRFKMNLGDGWLWTTQYGEQRLRSDDRLSYAFGCGGLKCDRFYGDGSFDLYDWQSNNEHRSLDAIQTSLSGSMTLGSMRHNVNATLSRQKQITLSPQIQTFVYMGTGNIDDSSVIAGSADYSAFGTNSQEYTSEFSINDNIELTEKINLWLGLRHSQLSRSSVKTDGSQAVKDQRTFNTPWIASSYQWTSGTSIYASYGEGIEAEVAPNIPKYTNAGLALPIFRSKQFEIGIKINTSSTRWQATLFDITRPQSGDQCDGVSPLCHRVPNGQAHHRGIELSGGITQGLWSADASTTWINAKHQNVGINTDTFNGQTALNVPRVTVRSLLQYRWSQTPGLRTSLRLNHEGQRRVLENGSINLPGWTTVDFAAHYDTRIQGTRTEWTLGIDNLNDKKYWRESPKQFGHYYLYPGAPRQIRLSLRTLF